MSALHIGQRVLYEPTDIELSAWYPGGGFAEGRVVGTVTAVSQDRFAILALMLPGESALKSTTVGLDEGSGPGKWQSIPMDEVAVTITRQTSTETLAESRDSSDKASMLRTIRALEEENQKLSVVYGNHVDGLNGEIRELQGRILELDTTLRKVGDREQVALSAIRGLQKALKDQRITIETLQDRLQDEPEGADRIRELEGQLSSTAAWANQVTVERNVLAAKVPELETRIHILGEKLQDAQETEARLIGELDRRLKERDDHNPSACWAKINDLEARLQDDRDSEVRLIKERDRLIGELSIVQDKNRILQARLAERVKALEDSTFSEAQLAGERNALEDKAAGLEYEASYWRRQIGRLAEHLGLTGGPDDGSDPVTVAIQELESCQSGNGEDPNLDTARVLLLDFLNELDPRRGAGGASASELFDVTMMAVTSMDWPTLLAIARTLGALDRIGSRVCDSCQGSGVHEGHDAPGVHRCDACRGSGFVALCAEANVEELESK